MAQQVRGRRQVSAKLVIGANGFLGSHVLRQLVASADGSEIRAMVRPNAATIGIDDLDVKRIHGDVFDTDALREAMTGCDVVYHCVVDARGWLRDPAPLFRTNVEGTRNVLDVAVEVPGLRKFVYTSSYVTVERTRGKRCSEDDIVDVSKVTPYVRSRVQAEDLVLQYARERGLPAVAMCVSTTYGSGDWGRTPHGAVIAGAAFGKLPFVMSGIDAESVGIDDAAKALILAADRGTPGERYLISEKMISNAEVARLAAEAAGVAPPQRSIPLALSYVMAAAGTLKGRLRGTDEQLSLESLRLMRAEAELDHSKAVRELGWQPRPVEESIAEAAKFWVGLRAAKRARKSS